MNLTDKAIRAAAPREKPYKMADGDGLHLLVTKAGGKLWRYRYEIGTGEQRREKLLALGAYPSLSLAEARKAREEARSHLTQGLDPAIQRKLQRARVEADAANTFEAVARAWHKQMEGTWSEGYAQTIIRNFEADVFPAFGALPVRSITPRMVLAVLREVEGRTRHVARKLRQSLSAVFVHAIAEDLADTDPAAIVRTALRPAQEDQHHPALTDPAALREMLTRMNGIPGWPQARLANRLLALTAVRSKELRGALRDGGEFHGLDGPEPLWIIPAARMKGRRHKRRQHEVPLSRQAVEVVKVAMQFAGPVPFLFPSPHNRQKCLGQTVLNRQIHSAGYDGKHTPHGWRAAFSTVMNHLHPNEQDRATINLMLHHTPGNAVEAAYNRAAYMPRRREIAQEWADLLMEGQPSAMELIQLPRSGA